MSSHRGDSSSLHKENEEDDHSNDHNSYLHSAKSSYCNRNRILKLISEEVNGVDELESTFEEDDEEDDQEQYCNSHSVGDYYSESSTSCCQHNPDKPSQPQNNLGPNSILEDDNSANSSLQDNNHHLNFDSKGDVDEIIEEAHVRHCNSHSEGDNDNER